MNNKFPFFFIIDDGGFPYAGSVEKPRQVVMENYGTVLSIAQKFDVKIPICFTLKYLDRDNISGFGSPLTYADELITFLKDNFEHLEIGYHGLTHEYNNQVGEFYCLDSREPIPLEIQREHLEKSAEILTSLGLPFPQIFVPPYHAWESGVTDQLVSRFGVKYLVTLARLRYNGLDYEWRPSQWLQFLPREVMGIYSYHTALDAGHLEMARKLILPRTVINNVRLRRTIFNSPVHSYMSHIGNFFPENYETWVQLLDWVKGHPRLQLCANNEEAVASFERFNDLK